MSAHNERVARAIEAINDDTVLAALRTLGQRAIETSPAEEDPFHGYGLKDPRYNYAAARVHDAMIAVKEDFDLHILDTVVPETVQILRHCFEAYKVHCREAGKELDITELQEMIDRSASLLDKFMGMSNGAWKTFATSFNTQDKYEAYPECKIIIDGEPGKEFFTPDKNGWRIAMIEAIQLGKNVDPTGKEVCPARGLFGNTYWKQVGLFLCTDPDLFCKDIEDARQKFYSAQTSTR